MSTQDKQCTQLVFSDKQSPPLKEVREALEKGNDEQKYDALRKLIMLHLNGEPQPKLLMTVIRFVLPSKYKPLKKLLLYYWEVVEKTARDGKLLPELILVCSHLRNDLIHPNEYIRGSTLRFLTKIREVELLEPLIIPVVQNLEHRHSYVRRNAVLAVYSIYKLKDSLIPDAPEQVENFLRSETDISSKRNAFIMLFDCDQERAIKYLRSIIDTVSTTGDSFQLVLLNLLRKMCKSNPNEKAKYLKVISSLMESKSSAVMYQCAGTLTAVSSSPAAIKAAAACYVRLLLSHTDNNVKLIVLERLVELKNKFPTVMQQIIVDIMRGLTSPEVEYKKKVLEICMDLVSTRNVDIVTSALKKELQKSQENETDKAEGEYRKLVVQALHKCALKFPEVAQTVILALDLIGDSSGTEVATFAREMVETNTKLRAQIVDKLSANFSQINSARVYRIALWILGEYCESEEQIIHAFNAIKSLISSLIRQEEKESSSQQGESSEGSKQAPAKTTVSVRADGTYSSQTSVVQEPTTRQQQKADSKHMSLKGILVDGNYFVGAVVASTLSKLGIRYASTGAEQDAKNKLIAEAIQLMCAIVRTGHSIDKPSYQMDKDTLERIALSIRLLAQPNLVNDEILFKEAQEAFASILKERREKQRVEHEAEQKERAQSVQPDSLLNISQLKGKKFLDAFEFEEEEISRATESGLRNQKHSSRLSRVTQLTGFSDAVYAEATVTIHQYDIMLDVLVVNQTNDTLQNLTLELATVGDLKLYERPQSYTLAPFASQHIKASIKVSSTETGIIFGNIIYDVSGAGNDSNCIVLNDVHIDIMDYIAPAYCDDMQFRNMWFEFEWENKIPIQFSNPAGVTLREFLDLICKETNMNCLTPESAISGECEFLSANLYARSSFAEDALANVSIEKLSNGRIEGFVRIRSKTQGIALSLGNKISAQQKRLDSKNKTPAVEAK